MDWKKVNRDDPRSSVPKDRPFLALWKGAICLCEFDEEVNHFFIGCMPASYLGFWKLDRDREAKFTHWCELVRPEEY